jgi:hypothetical protein
VHGARPHSHSHSPIPLRSPPPLKPPGAQLRRRRRRVLTPFPSSSSTSPRKRVGGWVFSSLLLALTSPPLADVEGSRRCGSRLMRLSSYFTWPPPVRLFFPLATPRPSGSYALYQRRRGFCRVCGAPLKAAQHILTATGRRRLSRFGALQCRSARPPAPARCCAYAGGRLGAE